MTASVERLHGCDPGLTIGQAASRLHVSPSTARRWVRSGRLRSVQVALGEGFEYRIPLDALEGVKTSIDHDVNPSSEPSVKAYTPTMLEASVERSAAVAAYNAQLLAPLVAVIERQADRVAELERENGRQSAELAAAESTIIALGEEVEALKASQANQESQQASDQPAPTAQMPRRRSRPAWEPWCHGCWPCWRSSR